MASSDITVEVAVPFTNETTVNLWWLAAAFGSGMYVGHAGTDKMNNVALKRMGVDKSMREVRKEGRARLKETKLVGNA